ncbi:MAG: GNAT family N-acetyltransferase [Muribaculaceae bacterium]|nr:GNAT family N-acetyltransferase [Muribaculaceae bacterium]
MKKEDFRKIFTSSFTDCSEEWRNWFFDNVVKDESGIYLESDSHKKNSAALLMQPYTLLYMDSELPTGYISCVATLPERRSQGLASTLLTRAIREARDAGYAMVELIPSSEALTPFYSRNDFATVFYQDVGRYTSLHTFREGRGALVEPTYALFSALERDYGCGILHTEADYAGILADMALDGGAVHLAAMGSDGGAAMLFAADAPDGSVAVKALLGSSKYARRMLLHELRRIVGERDITVRSVPSDRSDNPLLKPYGMARITRPDLLLGALAKAVPHFVQTIRLTDDSLPENSGIYVIGAGECRRADEAPGKVDLDISTETLAALLFGSHETGDLFGIPSRRPFMSLMLD